MSDEHFSVDGTQIAAWASMKSFRAKDGSDDPPGSGRNGERDFHGETSDGEIVLLTRLCEGQHATVLQLPAFPRPVKAAEEQKRDSLVK